MRDDAGENISAKNPQFCELTAQYWVWRNACADCANVGFVHYNRAMSGLNVTIPAQRFIHSPSLCNMPGLSAVASMAAQFAHDLTEVDVVLPEPWILTKTIRAQFAQFHNIDDLHTVARLCGCRCSGRYNRRRNARLP